MAHNFTFDFSKWSPVPYNHEFANDYYQWEKPTFVIANRYNQEWQGHPITYFDIPTLDKIIKLVKDDFQVVYNRPGKNVITGDNSQIKNLEEWDWLRRKHPEVMLMNDLYEDRPKFVENYNHLQLLVYANCGRFASVHGGTAALASCFWGHQLNIFQ